MTSYPQTDSNPDFSALEKDVLEYWQQDATFSASVEQREDDEYIFFDGPPFANGLPHYGHLLTSCVKDSVARYQTMKGNRVERRFGWDCHGLPAEMEAEKQLGIQGQLAILDFGIEKFNAKCRSSVMQYTSEWQDYINRQARWVDFENDYKTMDTSFMQSVIWAFKTLYDKGLIYEGHKVMPYSWACETPLSNFETRMDNSYREKKSNAITVKFKLDKKPKNAPDGCANYYMLAWTTTPWTLPSNVALAVGADIEYNYVIQDGDCLILGSFAGDAYKDVVTGDVVGSVKGSDLVGLTYAPLFPYFKDTKNAFQVLEGDFVEAGDGTGIVHLAPGFGEDDMRVCLDAGICTHENGGVICPVDEGGKFTGAVPDFKDLQVFDANVPIIKHLKEAGNWLKTEQYIHNYPHCWRTDTPLIYKAVPSWYVKVTAFKERMVELNQKINWIPGHIKDGLFGKWLENAHDWAISRNRFWGAPIPIWRSNNPDNDQLYVFGTIAELEEFFDTKVDDLHRPFIDNLTKPDPINHKYTISRVPEVLDCWFESGSMPFAQTGYIGNADHPEHDRFTGSGEYLSDFIVEYTAQTRGWFYTLMILSTALFDKAPFKNCICHGVILDENRQKLSKRLRNYPDPKEVYDTIGADAMRLMMISSPVMLGGELQVNKDGKDIRDALRLSIKPLWNAYHFFTLYANSDEIKAEFDLSSAHELDRYILAKLGNTIGTVTKAMDEYNIPEACSEIDSFIEVLNNWYIRRNRERFWRKNTGDDADKQAAYNTLYSVLCIITKAAAPILPLTTEAIYRNLTSERSVHLADFPDATILPKADDLVKAMDKIQEVCNAGLSIRNAVNIRIRQPLQSLMIYGNDVANLEEYSSIIEDELNVKEVALSNQLDEVAELQLKINFPLVGKRLGSAMPIITKAAKSGDWKQDGDKIIIGKYILESQEFDLTLKSKTGDATAPLPSNDALVVLDINITSELELEGIARDIVRLIQQDRKDADLNISDRIMLHIKSSTEITQAINTHKNYIMEQTLSTDIILDSSTNAEHKFEHQINDSGIKIEFSVAG